MKKRLSPTGEKKRAVLFKIRHAFFSQSDEFDAERSLMFFVVQQAIRDLGSFRQAEQYLRGEIPHAELCGVNSEYIHRLLFETGLLKRQAAA